MSIKKLTINYLCPMNVIRIVIELLALYLLYKLVFDLIIPLTRTTREVKKQVHEMNTRVQQKDPPRQTAPKGDYIDFEEVK
jgi:hypothetical protein